MRFSFALPALLYFSSSFLLTNAAEAAVLPQPEGKSVEKSSAPPLKELGAADFKDTIKSGYWWIKYYSPYCPHCKLAAPVWQAIYEYYVQSSPASASSPHPNSPPSFTETYDMHFANVNCVTNGDMCQANDVDIFPLFSLYKDGKLVEKYMGEKKVADMSKFLEKYLEKIKPGSRPAKVEIPEPPAVDLTGAIAAKPAPAPPSAKAGEKPIAPLDKEAKDAKAASDNSKPTPNPDGKSVALDAAVFQKKVLNTRDGWFVKFYAPWCHHCQAMAPAWMILGQEMKGTLNIGEVNCEVERRLCKDVKLQGYPTIIYFQGEERTEYNGLRGLGDLVSWAKQAADAGVKEIGDAADFEALEKKNEVIFLYFYDHATTSEDFAALDRVTLPLIGHAPLYKTNSELLARKFRITTWPRLVVSRDGRPSYYPALSPADMRDKNKIIDWMKTVWLPIVPELSASNSHEIMDDKMVVLAVLDRRQEEEFDRARDELKKAAKEWMDVRSQEDKRERQELRDRKQLRIEEAEDRNDERALRNAKGMHINLPRRREVGFAWVDGVFWERWLKQTYGVEVKTTGPRIIINEENKKRYWDETPDHNPILPSRSAILETVREILRDNGSMKSKSTVGRIEGLFRGVKEQSTGHPILTVIFVILFIFGVYLWRARRRYPSQHHHGMGLNDGSGSGSGNGGFWSGSQSWFGNEKEGLFGNGGGGKYD